VLLWEAAEKVRGVFGVLPAVCSIFWDDRGMQGFEVPDLGLLEADGLTGHLMPEGGMFAFMAAHRAQVFPDADYADLFAAHGRPSIPATRMAAILTLQALHGFSDRETAEAVRFDLRWKWAAGLSLDDAGIHYSSLPVWRRRLADSARPHRVNEAVRKVTAATGIVRGRKRAADSAILEDAVASQDTVTQVIAAMRRVLREVPGAAEVIAAGCAGFDYAQGRRPVVDWSDPQAAQELISALVNDANAVVEALRDAAGRLDDGQAAALALLAVAAGQDVEPAEGSDGTDGRWKIAQKVSEDRVISQTDPESRHARKNWHTRTDGYRAHLAADPGTGIITDEDLTMACGDGCSDAAAAARFVAREHEHDQDRQAGSGGDSRLAWYADSAYGTGELRAAIAGAGDTAVIKPKALRQAVPGGFTIDDFTADHQAGTVTCPAGTTRAITPGRRAFFTTACRGCPLRSKCTTSAKGKVLVLTSHDRELRQARRDWAENAALRRDYKTTRPNIERIIARVITSRGRRLKSRYRGTARNKAWLKTRTAAVNLDTLLRHGLTRAGAGWTLTAAG
jgi:transposase